MGCACDRSDRHPSARGGHNPHFLDFNALPAAAGTGPDGQSLRRSRLQAKVEGHGSEFNTDLCPDPGHRSAIGKTEGRINGSEAWQCAREDHDGHTLSGQALAQVRRQCQAHALAIA
jgi:hypothetical protein